MWPYNEDEAGWLKPRERAEPARRVSANDNDSARHAALRKSPAGGLGVPDPTLHGKS